MFLAPATRLKHQQVAAETAFPETRAATCLLLIADSLHHDLTQYDTHLVDKLIACNNQQALSIQELVRRVHALEAK